MNKCQPAIAKEVGPRMGAAVALAGRFGAWKLGVVVAALAGATWFAAAQPRPVPNPALAAAGDQPLVTDLSSHLIAITSSFTGTELLVFGAVDEAGDIVVVIRGPAGPLLVRRKERVGGIWINNRSLRFDNVPAFYAVAANRPLAEIGTPGLLGRLQIGAENLRLAPARVDEELDTWRTALIRNKQKQELYPPDVNPVAFLGQKLFRARIELPATVPVGTYRAEVYLIRGDRVVAAQATPLFVDKQGSEQAVYDFAHQQPLVYGLGAVAIALAAGWLAALAFRRA
jgi:uncharacterized protein (TIGR02186 family)